MSPTPLARLVAAIGVENVLVSDAITDDYTHDEALSARRHVPIAVVLPTSAEQVALAVAWANEHGVPVTPRGAGTGLAGACVPEPGGVVIAFDRMKRIVEIDVKNHVAVVQAGVTLAELNAAAAAHGLVYPVFPGEDSATFGGTVATNAGGMRAVKYGVTRHHVLGLEAVLGTGEPIRTGGKLVKSSSGYDLTQLIIGSEGTLAIVTSVVARLVPRLLHTATLLAPYASLEEAIGSVSPLIASGVGPVVVEYIDEITMMAITAESGISLGIDDAIRGKARAYLLVVVEGRAPDRVAEDSEHAGGILSEHGALDVFVLPAAAATELVRAREKSFWAAKRASATEVVDVVVPRASLPRYMQRVQELSEEHGTFIAGCGHAGDGNVHLAVFEQDPVRREALLRSLFREGRALMGSESGEHGIGVEKKRFFMELESPINLALLRRIKQAFDPKGVLNPGKIFD